MADLRFRRQILNLRDNWRCKDLPRHVPNYGTRGVIRNLNCNCRSPLPCNSFHAGISPAESSPHHSQNLSLFQQRRCKAVSMRYSTFTCPYVLREQLKHLPAFGEASFREKKKKIPIKQTTPTQPGTVPTAKLMSNNYCKVSLSREKMVLCFPGKKLF